jgi:3-phenylpropionate/trans-cinnamate dioxygenase ferredoxin reductase subunit
MDRYQYIIVGGGMTADAAVRGVRQVDAEGAIAVIGREGHPPYDRPPLTKGLWKGAGLEKIWRGTESVPGVDLRLDREVEQIDLREHSIRDDRGESLQFGKLLLATGGSPKRLPFGDQEFIYFRYLEDYTQVREHAEAGDEFAIIGGGFIGSEIAAALAMNGFTARMLFPEIGIGALVFPEAVSLVLNHRFQDRGVSVYPGELASGLKDVHGRRHLVTQNGRVVPADRIVAGVGIEPNVELARGAGLAVDDGVIVDQHLQTSHPDVFAAGDVASFYNPALDRRIRVEHEDNANTMGELAGRSMAGEEVNYDYLPYFYSDLFDDGYEAVGILDSRLETLTDWQEPFRKGVVYYLQDHRVRGVLLWNVWDQVPKARALIADPGPFEAADLRGRIT